MDFVRDGAAERKLSTSSRMVRAAVPAAGDQPAEETVGRGSRIDVKGLRIEPFSKRYDSSCVDADTAALAGGARGIVLKVAQIVIFHLPRISARDP